MKSIAIVGAGSSGLITLKYVLDAFPNAQIVCFEKGSSVRGAWGNMGDSFVSTSSKYATQFRCFQQYDAQLDPHNQYGEYYRGDEFGRYLDRFADEFSLRKYISFETELVHLTLTHQTWCLTLRRDGRETVAEFDGVFLCTGLVRKRREIAIDDGGPAIRYDVDAIQNQRVMIVGGGESAVDMANQLAEESRNNTVYLSLRSGVRVSPRYHPIRGVPSDYLRNRLLLSVGERVRNRIGDKFVEFRVKHREVLERLFPGNPERATEQHLEYKRKYWELKLKKRAKGELFRVFHTKSDAFLDHVATGRIQIVGPTQNSRFDTFWDFDQKTLSKLKLDSVLPSIGYRSKLEELSGGQLSLSDFYRGCIHKHYPNLVLVGFARPVIGNIPSIAEMQALYGVAILSKQAQIPDDIEKRHSDSQAAREVRFAGVDRDSIYPVEYLEYCDTLARELGIYPSLSTVGSVRRWLKIFLSPASTLHYGGRYFDSERINQQPMYVPGVLTAVLLAIRGLETVQGGIRRVFDGSPLRVLFGQIDPSFAR